MLKKILLLIGFVLIILVALGAISYFRGQAETKVLVGLVFNKTNQLTQQNRDINVLLLGIGGGNHEGPDLSDTIILANIKPSVNTVNLISIPRDLWIASIAAKINQAYADGQDKNGKGIVESRQSIESVTGQNIDYTVVVDFSGFQKLVDMLGGIDVSVQHTFDDYEYPIEGKETETCGHTPDEILDLSARLATGSASELEAFPCRYEHVHFDKGLMHMDGQTALIYVRSRHATGAEGSDFARSARQHQVISAIRDKVLSLGTILNPVKILDIYNLLKQNINTDIPTDKFDDFIKLGNQMKHATIKNYVIDMGDASQNRLGLLVNPPISKDFGYQWVLTPRIGNSDFSEIKAYITCIVKGNICTVNTQGILSTKPTVATPSATVHP